MQPENIPARAARWPFFFLIAAWFCANSPQSLTFNLMMWTKGARHFSHQDQLKAEVAGLLSGKNAQSALKAAEANGYAPPSVPIPEGGMLKRLDLSLSSETLRFIWETTSPKFVGQREVMPGQTRAQPPHGPPRALQVV